MMDFSTNLSTKGLPKTRASAKAIYEPKVNPIVDKTTPMTGPYKYPPMSPVTSPGMGATTTCRTCNNNEPENSEWAERIEECDQSLLACKKSPQPANVDKPAKPSDDEKKNEESQPYMYLRFGLFRNAVHLSLIMIRSVCLSLGP